MRVIQAVWGDIPEHIQPCLDSIKTVYPEVELYRFPASPYPIYESDKWRWDMLLKYDDVLYIDWDISIHCKFTFVNNKAIPSMAYFMGQPDNCLVYSPLRWIFQEYEIERKKRKISMETYGWYRKLFRDKTILEIKENQFKHIRTSGMSELKKQYSQLNGGTV